MGNGYADAFVPALQSNPIGFVDCGIGGGKINSISVSMRPLASMVRHRSFVS